MSEPESALSGALAEGFVRISDAGPRGMITIRADLADKAVSAAIGKHCGTGLPEPRRIVTAGDVSVAWMSPDELLVLLAYEQAPAMAAALQEALAGTHALVAVVSDARAVFRLEGARLREVLAKLTPADVRPNALPVGEFRRTRLAQAAAAFWLTSEETAEVICFRSVAHYMFALLTNAAKKGSEVNYF